MSCRKSPSEVVLTDRTNSTAATAQTSLEEHSLQVKDAGKSVPVTFSRKVKVASKQPSDVKENAVHTPDLSARGARMAETASPTLTDFLTPISEAQSSPPEAFLSARPQLRHAVSSSKCSRLGRAEVPAGEQCVRETSTNYPRKVAPSRGQQQGAAHAAYMARMAAHFAEVDDFDLTVDSPSAAGAASPDVAPQQTQLVEAADQATEPCTARYTDSNSAVEGVSGHKAASAYTAQWPQAMPSPGTQAGEGALEPKADPICAVKNAPANTAQASKHETGLEEPAPRSKRLTEGHSEDSMAAEESLAAATAGIKDRRLTLTAPEDEACDGEGDVPGKEPIRIPQQRQPRRSSVAGRLSLKGRMSLAHARKSLAGSQLQPVGRRSLLDRLPNHPQHGREGKGPQHEGRRRTFVYEALSSRFSLSQGMSRVSLGLAGALKRLSLGPSATRKDSLAQAEGDEEAQELLPGAAIAERRKRAISPIAESPDVSERDASATPEAVNIVADSSTVQAAQPEAPSSHRDVTEGHSQQLDATLHISGDTSVQPEQAPSPGQDLTPLQQLLKLCDQQTEVEALPSMEHLLGQHVKLRSVRKIGEGTFGEAFKGGDVVFKIVPMEGELLVNGEPQKKAEEMTAEVAIALTLSQLHPEAGCAAQNSTQGFVQTHGVGVCRGRYASPLAKEWHAWDKRNGSENDPVDMFEDDQLFVIFLVANGGADLEHFEVHSFDEARSIILQTALALAVAEEAVQFEHRDLHWGNLLVKRVPAGQGILCTLRGVGIAAESHGVQVTLIDFTLSRLCTINGSGAYCDLDADPELFQGPKGDCQADTYRRMRKATKGRWEGFYPATNALWTYYLADTLLNLKAFPLDPSQKKRLRDFRKRALSGRSCSDLLMDEFLRGCWLAGGN